MLGWVLLLWLGYFDSCYNSSVYILASRLVGRWDVLLWILLVPGIFVCSVFRLMYDTNLYVPFYFIREWYGFSITRRE